MLQSLAPVHSLVRLLCLGCVPIVGVSSTAAAEEVMRVHDLAFVSWPMRAMDESLLYGCASYRCQPPLWLVATVGGGGGSGSAQREVMEDMEAEAALSSEDVTVGDIDRMDTRRIHASHANPGIAQGGVDGILLVSATWLDATRWCILWPSHVAQVDE